MEPEAAAALSAAAGIGASLALVGGPIRLVRRHGVTLQAFAGALAITSSWLIFAWLIGFVAYVSEPSYFTQGGDGSQADRVSQLHGHDYDGIRGLHGRTAGSAAGSRSSRCSSASSTSSR